MLLLDVIKRLFVDETTGVETRSASVLTGPAFLQILVVILGMIVRCKEEKQMIEYRVSRQPIWFWSPYFFFLTGNDGRKGFFQG